MSASGKFDISSASPDRPLYGSGHRGSYGAASLDRSGNYRENMENPILSSLPKMTRSTSSITQGDVLNFFQCVRFDPKSVVIEHKLNRPADFKRIASAAFSIPVEDSLPTSLKSKQLSISSPEDLRRLKSGVRESATKARERIKILNDCLSVINKCFPTIPSKKRSRLDALSNDRSYTLLPIDRSAAGMGIGKMGSQNHASTSDFELEQQNCEERTKNGIPNKRPRTSMIDSRMDVRANTPARLSGTMEKDRDVVRLSNSGVVQGDDRTLSIPVDGWEKSKMKKKRTGIKLDMAASSMATKPLDGYRESRQGSQQRLSSEARSRLTDTHGIRSGISSGGASAGKDETTSQTSSGMRSSISRTDSENSSFLHERRECPVGQEKERVNLKSVNKENSREDFSSGSPTSGSKLNVNVRGPRSALVGGVSKLSPVVPRSTSSNDWELSNCTSKLPGVLRTNNRKRTPSARSSSPPVANWVQKPQKISRTARRTNLLPIVPGNEKNSALHTTPNMMENERMLPAHSHQQAKIKSENFSAAALSESEESGAAEVKLRVKSKKCDEIDEKSGQNVQKMSTLLLPSRKNKALSGDGHVDGVRRQGRTGRGFTSSRSLLPLTVEKLGNVGTTKQMRSSRLGVDKTERAGRPPSRKLTDRKAYTRHKHVAVNMTTNFLVGSDDGHEELLAAANAVTNTAQALSSSFWKKVETLFRFISDKDISYLKNQVNLGLAVNTPALEPLDTDSSTLVPNGCGLNEFGSEGSETRSVELSSEHLTSGAKAPNEISLYQRLMASFIPEEENPQPFLSEKDDKYDVYGSRFEEKDVEVDTFCSHMSQSFDLSGYPPPNGYGVNIPGKSFFELDHTMQDTNIVRIPDTDVISSYNHLQNGLLTDQVMAGIACSEYQYHNMSINERLFLEVKSIGIYPDLEPDLAQSGDEELKRNLTKLDEKYQEQVSWNKSLLDKLLISVSEAKELQEKNFEGQALEKLVGMAYEKYMSCWGPNVHGMKSASGKMAKQAALAFVRRALERNLEFEVTGRSCFSEPLYKDIFLSGVSRLTEGQTLNSNTNNESGKLHHSTSGCSIDVRTSAPVGTKQSPSNNQETYSSDPLLVLGSEQNIGKEDTWSNKVKRRELLIDDVGGTINTSSGVPTGLGGSLSCSAKGKRSEREREGKGISREVLGRSGTTKLGRPALATVKGDRKSKAKPKQKTAHLSASINDPLRNVPEKPKRMLSSTLKSSNINGSDVDKDKDDYNMEMLEEPIDLSGLQLPEMDDLGVPDDLGGQGEDLGSWLNIEDDGLQDHDFIGGLQIPMDDLTDLNMMV